MNIYSIDYKLNNNNNSTNNNLDQDNSSVLIKLFLYIILRYFI
jgi:hypothetical protein